MAIKDSRCSACNFLERNETISTLDSFPFANGRRLLYDEGKIN